MFLGILISPSTAKFLAFGMCCWAMSDAHTYTRWHLQGMRWAQPSSEMKPPFWLVPQNFFRCIYCLLLEELTLPIPNEFPFASSVREMTSACKGQVLCGAVDSQGYIFACVRGTLGHSGISTTQSCVKGWGCFRMPWCGICRNENAQGSTPNMYSMILENSR